MFEVSEFCVSKESEQDKFRLTLFYPIRFCPYDIPPNTTPSFSYSDDDRSLSHHQRVWVSFIEFRNRGCNSD